MLEFEKNIIWSDSTKAKLKELLVECEKTSLKTISSIAIDDLDSDTGSYLFDTSLEFPLYYSGAMTSCLNINREFFETKHEEAKQIILNAINSTKENIFLLRNQELINNDVIQALVSNKNIKNITIEDEVYLDKRTIEYILSSHISHLNCNVNFDNDPELLYQYIPGLDIINYPEVAGASVMDFGKENVELYVIAPLSEKELTHLKILFTLYPQDKIYINFQYKYQIDELIDAVNSDKIIIRSFSPFTREEYIHLNDKYDNVFFSVAGTFETSIESLILREDIMDNIIKEVNGFNLSPLEKYMYLYNIVKMYKEYKEVDDLSNYQLSRFSVYTLFNDYMVCVGYATLLEELIEKLDDENILCVTYGCGIQEDNKQIGHCKCMIKIKDEKYGIEGIYISDPTWDAISYYKKEQKRNGKQKINYKKPTANIDFYNHLLLTKQEVMDELVSYTAKDASDALFNVNFKEITMEEYGTTMSDIRKINERFKINVLTNKANNKNKQHKIKTNPIPGNILVEAITNLYSIIYEDSNINIDNLVYQTVENNILKQYKYFDSTKNKFGVKLKRKK